MGNTRKKHIDLYYRHHINGKNSVRINIPGLVKDNVGKMANESNATKKQERQEKNLICFSLFLS